MYDKDYYCFQEKINDDLVEWKLFICQEEEEIHKNLHFTRKLIQNNFKFNQIFNLISIFSSFNFTSFLDRVNFFVCVYRKTPLDCAWKNNALPVIKRFDDLHYISVIVSRMDWRNSRFVWIFLIFRNVFFALVDECFELWHLVVD